MKRTFFFAALVTVALAAARVPFAQAPRAIEAQLKAAQHKEEVEGDLKGAIEQYKKIVRSGDRALEARALIRMAECYRKLGDKESRTIYEQVVRQYSDQHEAVARARRRLNGARYAAPPRGDRAVWTGPNVDLFGRVSPDGRFITFVDWTVGDLAVHDVVANTDRALTTTARATKYAQFAEQSTVSRDGKQVAYSWFSEKGVRELRTRPLHGSGSTEARTFFAGSDEIRFISPYDWSPDGIWVAVAVQRNDGAGQIVLVNVADGSLRVLKSVSWSVPEKIFFSLDGKYIAYDLPAADSSEQRDIFIMATDASREIAAVVHPAKETLMGWSPDGTRLLFSSDRTGAVGLWALTFADGKPKGAPELLRADIGPGISLGLTASGALYLYKNTSSRDVKVAPIDLVAGKVGSPSNLIQGFVPRATDPHWSPDGRYLAYQACGGDCIAIRSVETGEVRKLPRTLLYTRRPHWSPDGRSFIVAGRDKNGRDGIFRVDVQSGETRPVVTGPNPGSSPRWSRDGLKIYYVNKGIVERDLATGVERKLTDVAVVRSIDVSPDGHKIVARTPADEKTRMFALLVVPTSGEPVRELLRLPQPQTWGSAHTAEWTPDSQAVLVVSEQRGEAELLLVPMAGSSPRKLDIDVNTWIEGSSGGLDRGFSLSPDGRHVAFLMGKSAAEVWALENILPASNSKQ